MESFWSQEFSCKESTEVMKMLGVLKAATTKERIQACAIWSGRMGSRMSHQNTLAISVAL